MFLIAQNGALAQLGERFAGSEEVRSSILLGSTIFSFTNTFFMAYVKQRHLPLWDNTQSEQSIYDELHRQRGQKQSHQL